MRMDESSGLEGIARLASKIRRVTIPQHDDRLVLLVVKGHDALEIRNKHDSIAKIHVAWSSYTITVLRDPLAFEVEELDSTVASISHRDLRVLVPSIEPETMRT